MRWTLQECLNTEHFDVTNFQHRNLALQVLRPSYLHTDTAVTTHPSKLTHFFFGQVSCYVSNKATPRTKVYILPFKFKDNPFLLNMGFFHATLSHAVSAVMLHLHPGYHLCNRTWVPFTIYHGSAYTGERVMHHAQGKWHFWGYQYSVTPQSFMQYYVSYFILNAKFHKSWPWRGFLAIQWNVHLAYFLFYISVASPEKNRLNHCKYIVASNDLLWVILVPRRIHHYFFRVYFFVLETKVKNVPILQI